MSDTGRLSREVRHDCDCDNGSALRGRRSVHDPVFGGVVQGRRAEVAQPCCLPVIVAHCEWKRRASPGKRRAGTVRMERPNPVPGHRRRDQPASPQSWMKAPSGLRYSAGTMLKLGGADHGQRRGLNVRVVRGLREIKYARHCVSGHNGRVLRGVDSLRPVL